MTNYDERIIFKAARANKDNREPASSSNAKKNQPNEQRQVKTALSEEQLALAKSFNISPEEWAESIEAGYQRDAEQLRRAHHLIHLIDNILAKHYPDVICKSLFCYHGQSYKLLLKKRFGREHMEYFTSDLIDDLNAGRISGLKILEGIIAGAVAKL